MALASFDKDKKTVTDNMERQKKLILEEYKRQHVEPVAKMRSKYLLYLKISLGINIVQLLTFIYLLLK